MKNKKHIVFFLLSIITISNKACFKDATIDNVESYIENTYKLTCKIEQKTKNNQNEKIYDCCIATLALLEPEITKKDALISKAISILNNISFGYFKNQINKFKPKKSTKITPLFTFYKEPENKNDIKENNIIFFYSYIDKSIYKAKALLLSYWLEKSDYWTTNGKIQELYKDAINKNIEQLKILSIEPIEITKKANKKYNDVRITCDN